MRLVRSLLLFMLATVPCRAMEFTVEGDRIEARGMVEPGDAGKLERLLQSRPPREPGDSLTMRLSGSGGDTLAAIALGRAIRAGEVETRVGRSAACSGACAIAFLGGLRTYATGVGVGRTLEFGAALQFDPALTEAASAERPMLGAVLDFAQEMKGVDLGWLAQALTVAPGEATQVVRPRDITALKIDVDGLPGQPPPDWGYWQCRALAGKSAPLLTYQRVNGRSEALQTRRSIRRLVAGPRLAQTALGRVVARLGDAEALAIVTSPLAYRLQSPILEARRWGLERGAGFYYDSCLALRWSDSSAVMLLDESGADTVIEPYASPLASYDPAAPLWTTAPP